MHEGHTHALHGDINQTIALLTYMVEHNKHHAEELHELSHTLEHQGQFEAAALITDGLNYFRDGNDKLEAALEQVKGGE
ncbi:MAG: hypothetical protein AB7D36_06625 [Oscillospiraceae bacterium]